MSHREFETDSKLVVWPMECNF